jgi:hypothetical protein
MSASWKFMGEGKKVFTKKFVKLIFIVVDPIRVL